MVTVPVPVHRAVIVELSQEPGAHWGSLGDGAVRIHRSATGQIVAVEIPNAIGVTVEHPQEVY
jgi:hypothetical protein